MNMTEERSDFLQLFLVTIRYDTIQYNVTRTTTRNETKLINSENHIVQEKLWPSF